MACCRTSKISLPTRLPASQILETSAIYHYYMKSTKVQNPRRIASRLVHLYANARARKLATPRVL